MQVIYFSQSLNHFSKSTRTDEECFDKRGVDLLDPEMDFSCALDILDLQ